MTKRDESGSGTRLWNTPSIAATPEALSPAPDTNGIASSRCTLMTSGTSRYAAATSDAYQTYVSPTAGTLGIGSATKSSSTGTAMVHAFMSVKVTLNCPTMPGENARDARALS